MKSQSKVTVIRKTARPKRGKAIDRPVCCPPGGDVAKAAAGTLFMASKLLAMYEADIGLNTQPMAELMQKAVSDWALKHGASAEELSRALADWQDASQSTNLGCTRH